MTWIERPDKRTRRGKIWQDDINPRKFSCDYTMAALHRESTLGSGVYNDPVDCTLVRVNNPQFDGWRVNQADWHYALGKDLANHGQQDGWVGFGGRRGSHWFKFRLRRVGYLHLPTKTWDDIGGTPDYDRASLTRETHSISFPSDGSEQPVSSVANWSGLWSMPGGGDICAAWVVNGDGLKEEVTLNQAGREWIGANRPPGTPANETYFGFVFDLDWSDVPRVKKQGLPQNVDGDFEDDGDEIQLTDALDRLLAFMPISDVIVKITNADTESMEEIARMPLKKRFWLDGDQHLLLVGARVDQLNALPEGDLLFDPTVDYQVGASSDDAWESTGGTMNLTATDHNTDAANEWSGFRWTGVTIDNGSVIDVAWVDLAIKNLNQDEPNVTIDFEDASAPGTFTTTSSDISNRTGTTATLTWDDSDYGITGTWQFTSDIKTPPELKTIIQELEDSYDYNAGSSMVCRMKGIGPTTRDLQYRTYDGDTSKAAKLHIEFTAGGTTFNQSVAGTLTSAGVPVKEGQKPLSASLSAAGILARATILSLAGALSSAGTLSFDTFKAIAGALSTAGSLAKLSSLSTIKGSLSSSGTLSAVQIFLQSVAGTLSTAGSIVRDSVKPLSGTVTSAGTVVRVTLLSITGALTTAGTTVKETLAALTGALSFSGAVGTVKNAVVSAIDLTLNARSTALTLVSRSSALTLVQRVIDFTLGTRD